MITLPAFTFLADGGQAAAQTLDALVGFVDGAHTSLDIAVYDAHLEPPSLDRLIGALDAAEARGVRIRAVYNDEAKTKPGFAPPEGPSALQRLAASVPSTAIPGVPDLMHHKYIVRDATDVWTGSTNWTEDAWTHMENVIVTLSSADLAAAYANDFDELWNGKKVEGSGTVVDQPTEIGGAWVRAMFSPGRGRQLGQRIAGAVARAQHRVRICSPVLTSGPILSTLAESLDERRCDVTVTVDGPQMEQALRQWSEDGRAQWKGPLFERVRSAGVLAEKASRPYQAGPPHNYMHAKVVVCDDVVFTGSFNCSHSGEFNAENVLEIRDAAIADQCVAFCDSVHARYAPPA
ncbi:MAG TPA: phospholipase D-like domain-containing protein [Acidimicrobiales bacterium]|nr:phospholipase D-like domain-containing protein [Acidimicrobiales bacterium]